MKIQFYYKTEDGDELDICSHEMDILPPLGTRVEIDDVIIDDETDPEKTNEINKLYGQYGVVTEISLHMNIGLMYCVVISPEPSNK